MAAFEGETFVLGDLVRQNIKELTPYRCARDDYDSGILLDANENSIGPPLSDGSFLDLQLNRYPDPLHMDVKQLIAQYRNVSPEQIFTGVGSDEAIDLLIRIFCIPREDNIVFTPPTYGMYKVCAKVNDVNVKTAPLTPSFDVDEATVLSTIDAHSKIFFLCSPGNPTSKVIPNEVIARLASQLRTTIVVVDEAYIDFSNTPSATCLLATCPNVVVMQTLSKAWGLAGIRLGMAIASPEIVQLMNNVKAPYNVNKLTASVALKALQAVDQVRANIDLILHERTRLIHALENLPFVRKVHHADANFILFEVPYAQEIYKKMADRGVVCRYRGNELHCDNCLRVTVGTPAENDAFLALLHVAVSEESGYRL